MWHESRSAKVGAWCWFLLVLQICVFSKDVHRGDRGQLPPKNMTLVMLSDPDAVCLDGSPGAFYFAPGVGTGGRKWLVWHEGKAWCFSHADCLARSEAPDGRGGWKASGGSCLPESISRQFPEGLHYMNNSQQLSDDPVGNPTFFNWNVAFVKTCDGGSFRGNRAEPVVYGGKQLYYRGQSILKATIDELKKRGIGNATDVVIGGGSAGALAAYLNIENYSRAINPLKDKRFTCLPDGGFFMDLNNKGYHDGMAWIHSQDGMQAVVEPACAAAHKDSLELCMFSPHVAPFIQSDIFALQAKYDAWQLPNILGSSEAETVNSFGANMTSLLLSNILNRPRNAVFIDSCVHHCNGWNLYIVQQLTQSRAFDIWYNQGSQALPGHGRLVDPTRYPCAACCNPHSSSLVV